jgi:hypothetical protein
MVVAGIPVDHVLPESTAFQQVSLRNFRHCVEWDIEEAKKPAAKGSVAVSAAGCGGVSPPGRTGGTPFEPAGEDAGATIPTCRVSLATEPTLMYLYTPFVGL